MKRTLLTVTIASLLVTTAFADPIHDAAEDGDLAGVQAQLDAGADVNGKDDGGMTPLAVAIHFKHPETADLLRKHGGKTFEELKAAGN